MRQKQYHFSADFVVIMPIYNFSEKNYDQACKIYRWVYFIEKNRRG